MLPFQNRVLKMPWKNQEIVRLHGTCLLFRYNRDMCSRCKTSELVFIHIRNIGDMFARQTTELKKDIAFGGSTIPEYCFSITNQRFNQVPINFSGEGILFLQNFGRVLAYLIAYRLPAATSIQ